jgi:flagellar hook-associated protein 3 FlgL
VRFDPNYVSNLSQAVSASSATEQKLTGQLSSGLRVSTLSDDPVAVAQNVLLSSAISRDDAFTQSSTREQSLLQVTDSTLGEVVSNVTSAISLAVKAGDGTLNASNLSAVAAQVSDIRDQVVQLANSTYLGQYLFSGSKGNTAPFTIDSTVDPETATYQGDSITQSIETPDGQKIQVNLSGSDIFSATGADLLGTFNQLVSDLKSGDTSNVATDTAALTNALGTVTTKRANLGGSLQQLTSISSYTASDQTQLKAQQSALLSADPATIATNLQTSEVQHEALLNVIAGLAKTNLFDYLQG